MTSNSLRILGRRIIFLHRGEGGYLVQGYLGWTCTAHEPVHAVGKESRAPLYCAPSPTRTYLGTGDHLGERRQRLEGRRAGTGGRNICHSARVCLVRGT